MTTAQLRAAIERARATLPWTATGPDGAATVCPGCGNSVVAEYRGPAKHRLSAMLVAYAAHLLMECPAA
jgi:hypothetical protein